MLREPSSNTVEPRIAIFFERKLNIIITGTQVYQCPCVHKPCLSVERLLSSCLSVCLGTLHRMTREQKSKSLQVPGLIKSGPILKAVQGTMQIHSPSRMSSPETVSWDNIPQTSLP